MVGRQRLYGVGVVVHLGDETQDALIDGAGQREAEPRVLRKAHIGETLVREGLDDGRRHLGHSCLGVVAVVEVATRPGAVEVCHIAHLACQHLVGQIVGRHT